MKKDQRPQMLLLLLVGTLVLSMGLNVYFLLQHDAQRADQELEAELRASARRQAVSGQVSAAAAPPDTGRIMSP